MEDALESDKVFFLIVDNFVKKNINSQKNLSK
jgi:hypothetical protein